MSKSNYEVYNYATLGQQASKNDPRFKKLVGTDRKISNALAFYLLLEKLGIIDLKSPEFEFLYESLDMQRIAAFATSEKTNEVTKLSFLLPKGVMVYDGQHDR